LNNKIIKTKGIVIREVNYGEADKMLTILTPDLGKVSCVAKGARKPKSRFLGISGLFTFSDFILFKGSLDTYTINSGEIIESFYNLRCDLDKLTCAMDITKILRELVQEGENSAKILRLYLNTLYVLSATDKDMEFIKIVFLIKLLAISGFAAYMGECRKCRQRVEGLYYDYKENVFLCDDCGKLNKSVVLLRRGTVAAIKYIVRADIDKVFSFELGEGLLEELRLFSKLQVESTIKNV